MIPLTISCAIILNHSICTTNHTFGFEEKKNNINNMTRSYICALNLWRLRVLRDECTFHILHVRVYIVFFFIFVGFHLEFTVFFFWNSYSFGECLFFSAHKFTFTRETLCKNSLILSFIVLMIFFICVVFLARSHRNDYVCRFFFVRLNDLSNTGIRDILKSFLWSRKWFRILLFYCERVQNEKNILLRVCIWALVNDAIRKIGRIKRGNQHFCWYIPFDAFKCFSLYCWTFLSTIFIPYN